MLTMIIVITCLFALANTVAMNLCDWVGALPALYHQYGEESCPPPHRHQENGLDCEWRIVPGDTYKCDSFCQVRTNFFYTMEAPVFSNPYCMGPATCSIGPDDHVAYNGGDNLGDSVDSKTLNDGVRIFVSYGGIIQADSKL